MGSLKEKEKIISTNHTTNPSTHTNTLHSCINDKCCKRPSCFFCLMKEQDPTIKRARIATCLNEMPHKDNQEHVLFLSSLWNVAMTQPDDPLFPSLGVFSCMSSLIRKGVDDRAWLVKDQNIYIPYYAAHVIGSYTMNKVEFAEKAVESSVVPSLMELLRGKITWVEQRVAVRALGHLASYERTFEAVAAYEEEVVKLAMDLASTCLEEVYNDFVDSKERLKYHSDLLTKGVGGSAMENRKAEEWASQLQCWSIQLLNCFACKERSLNLICNKWFLRDLCNMWGGLVNHTSPAGVGLIRVLCYNRYGRKQIADCEEVAVTLCNLSRSSDDWQYIGIDCLLLLIKDKDTRYKVMDNAILCLVDLVELINLGNDRPNIGEAITKALLLDYNTCNTSTKDNGHLKNDKSIKVEKALKEIWELKVDKRRRERVMSVEKVEEKRVLVNLIKQQGNNMFWLGNIEEAIVKYSEALSLCPLKLRKRRMVLYSNRAQCYLLLGEPEPAISDSTRALCLSIPSNLHAKSLWRRSQAYDIKGLAKESLMDCVMFLNKCINGNGPPSNTNKRKVSIPYNAVRMISKQMDATWLFANAKSKTRSNTGQVCQVQELEYNGNDEELEFEEMIRSFFIDQKEILSSLSSILQESSRCREGMNRK